MARIAAMVVLSVAVAVACAPSPARETLDHAARGKPLAWPQPPARARIRFVAAVRSPTDLGVRPSVWQKLGGLVAGKQKDWLIRPIGVAAKESVIYVADPGAAALWVVDRRRGGFHKVERAGPDAFVSPVAVAVGRDDRIYVADSYLGKVFIFAKDLTLGGTIEGGELARPAGLAIDEPRDRLYVADSATHRIAVYSGDGRPGGAIGERGTGDGEFNFPTHVAVDRAGDVYVTDALGFRVQLFTPDGRFAGRFGRHGDTSGDFARPKGIALDGEGHVYVVDALFDAVQIFDRRGRFLLSFGERGVGSGQFWLPVGLFIDRDNRIYVADSYNQRVQIFEYLPGGGDE